MDISMHKSSHTSLIISSKQIIRHGTELLVNECVSFKAFDKITKLPSKKVTSICTTTSSV